MKVALLLVGFGNVARRFVQLLDESRAPLAALDIEPFVVGIVTRRQGSLSEGLQQLTDAACDRRVLVETTTLDVRTGEPAISHVRAAFAAGAHVITANKGPVAFAYRALANEARTAGVSFLFEGAVMDGIPIFNLVHNTMPAVTINGFRGVVNSTTNYLLSAMEQGEPFDAALARMQESGVAEADASLDVDGWDAAAKTAALANVLLDATITPHEVPRDGVNAATGESARAALGRGRRLKVVASASGRGSAAAGRVQLVELPADDPLAILDGQANALEFDTWPLGRVVITQRDGGMEKTAYALLSDLVTLVRR